MEQEEDNTTYKVVEEVAKQDHQPRTGPIAAAMESTNQKIKLSQEDFDKTFSSKGRRFTPAFDVPLPTGEEVPTYEVGDQKFQFKTQKPLDIAQQERKFIREHENLMNDGGAVKLVLKESTDEDGATRLVPADDEDIRAHNKNVINEGSGWRAQRQETQIKALEKQKEEGAMRMSFTEEQIERFTKKKKPNPLSNWDPSQGVAGADRKLI